MHKLFQKIIIKKIRNSFYIARTSLIPKPENGPTKTKKQTKNIC